MKHLISLLTFFLFGLTFVFAQEFDSLTVTVYAFGDNVRIRESPNLNAKVVGKLRIGEEVTTLSSMKSWDDFQEINGHQYPWVQIRTDEGKEGYVWAGLLAHYTMGNTIPNWGEGLLMLGPLTDSTSSAWAFREAEGGKLLHERIFHAGEYMQSDHAWLPGDYRSTEVDIQTPEGFNPPLTFVDIMEGWCACGCMSEHSYFVWGKDNIAFAFGQSSEASPYVIDESYLEFPSDHGVENQIRLIHRYAQPRENEDEPHEEDVELTTTIYLWDGKELLKQED